MESADDTNNTLEIRLAYVMYAESEANAVLKDLDLWCDCTTTLSKKEKRKFRRDAKATEKELAKIFEKYKTQFIR